jgi:hypothetical protein
MTRKKDFFLVKEVLIAKPNALVAFETKLPGEAKRVIGYLASATKSDDKLSIAEIGISFNGGRENTINRELIVHDASTICRRDFPLSQNQKLLQNAYVKGFVEDRGVVQPPYSVKIYFHLSRN